VTVSIVIPVFNQIAFTRQCLERLGRHAAGGPAVEIIVVDNASSDDTAAFFREPHDVGVPLTYVRNAINEGFSRGNNIGARQARGRYLLFLNNDTLVTDGWLAAMVRIADDDPHVGIVGIKQLFPYTRRIHHTGIVFTADGRPQHIYPHGDASLPHVNRQREYQAVTGSCLLIPRDLFEACGGFDEGYRNGYEDIDLCLAVRDRGRSVVCCTSAFIYHYGQTSETRTDDDDANVARLKARWGDAIVPDEHRYFKEDRPDIARASAPWRRAATCDPNLIYFADDLSTGSALSWVTTELIAALERAGRTVAVRTCDLSGATNAARRRALAPLMRAEPPAGGIEIRWSHYWPQHLDLDLTGRLNLELFVINYQFAAPGAQPWDYWMQCLRQNRYGKLPLSRFCADVLQQVGVPAADCTIVRPGYSPEVHTVAPPRRRDGRHRLLTVTNSHDLERYGTRVLLDAYWSAFTRTDDVTLVVKDYGASSGDTTLHDLIRAHGDAARVEYIADFTSKEKLIELYKSCDAFVSAHRGEGYGMKILDALACGLPVITPLFGGPTDFCTAETCLPVDVTLAPVGDCFDTRALAIANGPTWAEPDPRSLAARLRQVVDAPDEARRLGERARASVIDRFTWDAAAKSLLDLIDAHPPADRSPRAAATTAAVPAERSPYWLGCRISVVIPTCNRSRKLRACLDALAAQTILPQEFEVIVVDDGSTDETEAVVRASTYTFPLRYLRQANSGPGAARNAGVREAIGETVLFLGDDIVADARLLESHLEAHARREAPTTAILGHIDWLPGLPRTSVMDFICGPAALQFGYALIPHLPVLDARFFYSSNVSIDRRFLVAATDGQGPFDPDFTAAAFEDTELAVRLQRQGLEIVYVPDARAFHDHWMDLDAFSRREYAAGRMAVVCYRKHPQLDEHLQVRWIGEWTGAVDELIARPALVARLRALDERTDAFLRSLAQTCDPRGNAEAAPDVETDRSGPPATKRPALLDAAYTVLFDVARTRGKVDEWYAGVQDSRATELAKMLIGCARRLESLSPRAETIRRARGSLEWLDDASLDDLDASVDTLERQLAHAGADAGHGLDGRHVRLPAIQRQLNGGSGSRRVRTWLRQADLVIQYQLHRHARGRFLPHYHAMRGRLKRWLPKPVSRP
jgi:GT2 family glycosyltransferase/glycosyltransferase involved in cell wall biosynthesis